MPTLVQGGTVTVGISPRWYCNSLYQSKVVLSLLVQVQGGTVTVGISPRWYCHWWHQSKVVLSRLVSTRCGTVTVGISPRWYCHCWSWPDVVLSLLVSVQGGTVIVGLSQMWYCHWLVSALCGTCHCEVVTLRVSIRKYFTVRVLLSVWWSCWFNLIQIHSNKYI
jgi:hypothetical protein